MNTVDGRNHARKAEELLEKADSEVQNLIAQARVHATLALAYETGRVRVGHG